MVLTCTPSNSKDKDSTNSLRLANSFRLSFANSLLLTAPLLLSRAASHRSVGVEKNDRLLTVHIQMITRKDLFLHLFHALINEL